MRAPASLAVPLGTLLAMGTLASRAAADSPPSKAAPSPGDGQAPSEGSPNKGVEEPGQPETGGPPAGVPNKGGSPPSAPEPGSPAPAGPTPSAPRPPAPKRPTPQPKAHPAVADPANAAAAIRELAQADSVKASATAALWRCQDLLRQGRALVDQAASSPVDADQLKMMAWRLTVNVPEAGSAAIEAERLRGAKRGLRGWPDPALRKRVGQQVFDLQQLANQMTGVLGDERAVADSLTRLAAAAP